MSNIPTRLLVQQRLVELLSTLVIDGVETDMTGAVITGKVLTGEEAKPLPLLSILESPRPDIASYAAEEGWMRSDKLTLLITGMCKDDKTAPYEEAYYLCAAVEERLSRVLAMKSGGRPEFTEHYMLGKLINSLEIAPPVVRPPDGQASAVAFFFLPLRVGISVEIGRPYTTVS